MASDISGAGRAVERTPGHGRAWVDRVHPWSGRLALPLVAFTLISVWHISGVATGEIARFLAFEALYVVLPGCLLYLLLGREVSFSGERLRLLAIGWPLGYAMEIGAFALTAAVGVRDAFAFLPLLVAVSLGPAVLYRRRRMFALPRTVALWRRGMGGFDWGVESTVGAIAIVTALVLLAVRTFATVPLPGHDASLFYFVDNVWDISMATEALHHWPIVQPYLAGHPLRYYLGVFIHVAAIKQVTGVSPSTAIFRLLPATSIVVAMLQFWCLGSLLCRSRWAGPVTVGLLLVLENLKLYPTHTKVFGVALFSEFTGSPTYGLGVVLLLGVLILFRVELLGMGASANASKRLSRGSIGPLALLAILILGVGAVKSTAMATFVGGLGVFWLWQLLRGHLDWLLTFCMAVTLACFAAIYFLMLSGSDAPAATLVKLAPLDFLKYTVFKATVASHPGTLIMLGAAGVIFLWKVLPVAGILVPLSKRGEWSPYAGLALSVFVVGFVVYFMMGSPGANESYFAWFGYIPLIPLGAAALVDWWGAIEQGMRDSILRIGSSLLILGLIVTGVTQRLSASGELYGARRILWYGASLALAGTLIALWTLRLERGSPRLWAARVRVLASCCLVTLGVLGSAESVVLAMPDTWRTALDRQVVARDSPSHPGISAALYRGLIWVSKHTGRCDILAVGTPLIRQGTGVGIPDSGYFYYSAFSEREVFFESWVMTIQGQHNEQPYPGLYALNDAATEQGNRGAIGELMRRGVSYMLVDRTHGAGASVPAGAGRLEFSNSALEVYRLNGRIGSHSC